jgi:hypothetical protein
MSKIKYFLISQHNPETPDISRLGINRVSTGTDQ